MTLSDSRILVTRETQFGLFKLLTGSVFAFMRCFGRFSVGLVSVPMNDGSRGRYFLGILVVSVAWLAKGIGAEFMSEHWKCERYQSSETIQINAASSKLLEVHIRDNVQGEVEIKDGHPSNSKIHINVDRSGQLDMLNDWVSLNQTLFDLGHGTIFVLQVDYIKKPHRRLSLVIVFAISSSVLLVVLSIAGWWIYKRFCRCCLSSQNVVEGILNDSTVEGRYFGNEIDIAQEDNNHDDIADKKDKEGNIALTQQLSSSPLPLRPPPPPPVPKRYYLGHTGSLLPDDESLKDQSHVDQVYTVISRKSNPKGLSNTLLAVSIICFLSVVYATCPLGSQAKITLIIPPHLRLDAVKLFFNEMYKNTVMTDGWLNKNTTQLHIFDLTDASATENRPCSGKSICPNAYAQNLAGCNAATGQCICQRGFYFNRGVCVDIDECVEENHQCPETATCQNTIGFYLCQCSYGFYGDKKFCKGCTVGCPDGSYEATPCSNSRDRVCSECTPCRGSTYEVRPCSPTSDRQCLHVAHPLLNVGKATMPSFLEEMKVDASENIFLEDLHSTRNLETTYYVTDMTQASDFYWDRESGLRVNIGILNVHLIPRYMDVDHESDNNYMLNNPNNSEDKTKFQNIVHTYCRHPIPDYYSITLEISRDRTTAAEEISCDSKDPTKLPCSPSYSNGDLYLHRTLNDACQKMGTFPEPLVPAANSIVCTDNSVLLREVFNQTYSIERPIRFPPKKCRIASSRCEQCLNQQRCLVLEVFERKCCQIDCYTLMDCKQMVSSECTFVPVECAMGDAYRYTIQPVFQNIKNEFQCHLHHHKYDILYELFYFIQIPGTDFQTPKVYKTVYAEDLNYQSRGEYQADYVTVEHNTGLNLKEEFMLLGHDDKNRVNFTVHALKTEDEYRRKRVVVREVSHNIFVASTQFEQPFDYSTSSWVRDNECNKNVSKMKVVQKHYGMDSQGVNVVTQKIGDQFTYFLKSIDNPPYLRFTVPGNMSILPYYFRNSGPYLLTKSSLRASLELTTQGRIWEIHISGKMSGCPAYLGIIINNRMELEELFRYDLLILCPDDFNLTFKVPNKGQNPEKTFDVQLQDSVKSYDVYLSQLLFESVTIETESGAMNILVSPRISLTLIAILAGTIIVLIVMFTVAYIYKEIVKARLIYASQKTNFDVSEVSSHDCETAPPGRHCAQRHRSILGLYFAFWIVYSLMFTFTILFTLLSLVIHSDLMQLSQVRDFQSGMRNMTLMTSAKIEQYSSDELKKQATMSINMQRACSNYIGELFEAIANNRENLTSGEYLQQIYGHTTSISYLFHQRTRRQLSHYIDAVEKYTNDYRDSVRFGISRSISKYHRYLQSILNNDWFSFPLVLFNASEIDYRRPLVLSEQHIASFGSEADFGEFLEIEEVEDVRMWPIQFWQRYSNQMPSIPDFQGEFKKFFMIQCTDDAMKGSSRAGIVVPFDHLDSSVFFASHLPLDKPTIALTKFTSINIAEEFRLFPSIHLELESSQKLLFHGFSLLENVNIDVLRLTFLLLDVLLLIYRFSNVYLNSMLLSRCLSHSANEIPASPSQMLNSNLQTESDAQDVFIQHLNNERTSHTVFKYPPDQNNTFSTSSAATAEYVEGYCTAKTGSHFLKLDQHDRTLSEQEKELDIKDAATSQEEVKHELSHDTTKMLISRMLRSNILPKVILVCVIAILFYLTIRAILLVLNMDVLLNVDLFGVYLTAINVQVNQTNWYLNDEANHFNEVTLNFYENQMNLELLNLQTVLEYFNAEQKRLVDNYVAEACVINRPSQVNWTCDISIVLPRLEIPMLPCNFIPIQAHLYTGFKLADYETEIGTAFQPFIRSTKSIIIRTSFTILVTISLVLTVNITASLLYYRFHAALTVHHRQSQQSQKVCCINDTAPSGETVHRTSCQHDGTDYDSEEYLDAGFQTCSASLHIQEAQQTFTNTTPPALQIDFKYSETKV